MRKPSPSVCALLLIFLSVAGLWLGALILNSRSKPKSLFAGAIPISLGQSTTEFTQRPLGQLSTLPTNAAVSAVQKLLSEFKSPRDRIIVSPMPARAERVPEDLRPKQPKLSEAQKRNLTKLRWGPSKSLRYSGDPQDATVRLLAAPALIRPIDPKNPAAESPEALTQRFLTENRELLLISNPAAEFVVIANEPDTHGGTILRLGQRLGTHEVWPGQITANISAAGHLRVITGTYAPTPTHVATTPQITAEAAQAAALENAGLSNQPDALSPDAPIIKIFADKGRTPELSYEVFIEYGHRHERVFVSAESGEVLHSISEICTAAMTGSGTDIFGQTRPLNVFAEGTPTRYYLVDTSKPMYDAANNRGVIAIMDAANIHTSPETFTLTSAPSLNTGYLPDGVSAAFNLSKAYDFYLNQFGRNSFDNNGASIIGVVRHPEPESSGFNASWNRVFMTFGMADNFAGATDIVGHEFAHAIIQYSSGLVYQYESGAVNESFADILGESLERNMLGSNDWLIGSNLHPANIVGGALRSMSAPNSRDQPAKMSEFVPGGGVHKNSGIPNHAFYLLAQGLPGGGVGFDPARNIFYRTLVTKLNTNSSFLDLRLGCILSAEELFGPGSVQVTKVRAAFDAVEIFDSSSPDLPEDLTPPSGPDSYLISYKAVDGNYYLGRREAAFGDGSSVTGISGYALAPDSRPSVSGDGSTAVFVSSTYDLILASTNGSGSVAAGLAGFVNSASISADANHAVIIFRDPSTGLAADQIAYINITSDESVLIPLYLPVADGGTALKINSVDEIDLSPDGQIALFDGLAETTLSNGITVRSWSLFAIDLNTRQIFSLAGPFENMDVGNPSFARTSSSRILLEALTPQTSAIVALDLTHQTSAIVKSYTPPSDYLAYPRFSAADDFIVFTDEFLSFSTFDYQPRVARVPLQSDKITPLGSATILQNLAINGLSYRRGSFAGAPVLTVSTPTPQLTGGTSGHFRISRVSGDQNIRVPITFKTLGSARRGTDYSGINLTTQLSPGVSYVDIPVSSLITPESPSRSLTLSLDPQSHYRLSSPGDSSTISLIAPPITFAWWTTQNGVGQAQSDDDRDGIPNLIEYFAASDPRAPTPPIFEPLIVSAGLDRFLQIKMKRNAVQPGVSWTLQRSTNLTSWQDASAAVVTDTPTELTVRDSSPLGTGPRFIRLRVTANP